MNIEQVLSQQGNVQPGTQAWWRVWGSTIVDAQVGDLIVCLYDGELVTEGPIRLTKSGVLRKSFLRPDGTWFSLGRLCRVQVYRYTNKNTLSSYVR